MAVRSFISKEEMDVITEGILIKAGVPISWAGEIQKIDIDAIIEFEYGLDIVWKNIDSYACDGIVLAAIDPGKKMILLNDSQKELFELKIGTMNFSKAHELGHWVLHVVKQQDYEQFSFCEGDVYYCRSRSRRAPEEVQADMFAASLLMPKQVMAGALNALKDKGTVNFPDLYALADSLEVSITALKTRAEELKLLWIGEDKRIYNSVEEAMGQISIF